MGVGRGEEPSGWPSPPGAVRKPAEPSERSGEGALEPEELRGDVVLGRRLRAVGERGDASGELFERGGKR